MSLRGPVKTLKARREAPCLMGRVRRVGRSRKVSFKFLRNLWAFRTCIYILVYKIKIVTNFTSNSYSIPLGPREDLHDKARRTEFMDGMDWWDGWMGWDGVSKVSFNFLYTLWVDRLGIYLLLYIIKFCHQHFYGFEILMSSWGVGLFFQIYNFHMIFQKSYQK